MTDGAPPDREHTPKVEIIPPDRGRAQSGRAQSRVWISIDTSRGQGRPRAPGLFGIIMAILVVIFVTAVVLMIFLSALLIWVPVIAVLVAGLLIVGLLRRRFRWRGRGGSNVPADQSTRGPENMS